MPTRWEKGERWCPVRVRATPTHQALSCGHVQVRLSMNRIKQVLSERLKEHEDTHIRVQLKAVIDAL